MNTMEIVEAPHVRETQEVFRAGDTVRVHYRIVEGKTERIQIFEGLVISRHNSGMGSSFTVRKISYGIGVERLFPLHSPHIHKLEVVRHGRVRRAKLYYIRDRVGKAARVPELIRRRTKK